MLYKTTYQTTDKKMLKPNIQDSTDSRVSQLTGKPLTKGFDKQINSLCKEVEKFRNQNQEKSEVEKVDCMCDKTKEVLTK